MITIDGIPIQKGDRFKMDLQGNSSDTMPTKEYKGMKIANASTFMIIDQADVKFYDQDSESWV